MEEGLAEKTTIKLVKKANPLKGGGAKPQV